MDNTELLKGVAINATNSLLEQHGLPPAAPACNTEAIEAYRNNIDQRGDAWNQIVQMSLKAALFDDLLKAAKIGYEIGDTASAAEFRFIKETIAKAELIK